MTVSAIGWQDALAHLQRDLDALDRALASGAAVVDLPWTPSVDLGPVPPSLRRRADELLTRLGQANQRLRETQEELVGRPQGAVRQPAAFHGVVRGTDRHHTA
ncbi:hypothetical protein [Nitriliruptor alkaliphilus]|uniref:hypothetical protein n=1 Tax=Nitriliruptor alkaliphilus TaxID=427918 RepID=UPI0012EE639F|nr:hypothetical protein [Nitriliruptor alkaliphilus]